MATPVPVSPPSKSIASPVGEMIRVQSPCSASMKIIFILPLPPPPLKEASEYKSITFGGLAVSLIQLTRSVYVSSAVCGFVVRLTTVSSASSTAFVIGSPLTIS